MSGLRWLIEISRLGQNAAPAESVCVEASGWQPAVLAVRAARGDRPGLEGFSIDLLADAVRAIDPMARLLYVVRRAAEDHPLTGAAPALDAAASLQQLPPKRAPARTVAFTSEGQALLAQITAAVAPTPPPAPLPPARVPFGAASDAGVPGPDAPAPRKRAVAHTVGFSSLGSAMFQVDPEPTAEAEKAPPVGAPPDPTPQQPQDDAPLPSDAPPSKVVMSLGEALRPFVGDGDDDLPEFTVLATRTEQPTPRFPLTYREVVYAVPAGTTEDQACALILSRFESVRAALAGDRPGKLINLAIFDHTFTGAPRRRPLATLTWKDWKGQPPEVRCPHREAVVEPTSLGGPASAVGGERVGPQANTAARSEAFATLKSVLSHGEVPADPRIDIPVVTASDAIGGVGMSAYATAQNEDAQPLRSVTPGVVSVDPGAPTPVNPRAELDGPEEPTRRKGTDAPDWEAGISQADDDVGQGPVAELARAFVDLPFLRDALEGAEFILSLSLEQVPADLGLVSLFDDERHDFVTVRQIGGTGALLCDRVPLSTPLVATALGAHRAVATSDPADVADDTRWERAGVPAASVLVAAVQMADRPFGLIELVASGDRRPFGPNEAAIVEYIADRFADFVAARGPVVDPAAILRARSPSQAPSNPPNPTGQASGPPSTGA